MIPCGFNPANFSSFGKMGCVEVGNNYVLQVIYNIYRYSYFCTLMYIGIFSFWVMRTFSCLLLLKHKQWWFHSNTTGKSCWLPPLCINRCLFLQKPETK